MQQSTKCPCDGKPFETYSMDYREGPVRGEDVVCACCKGEGVIANLEAHEECDGVECVAKVVTDGAVAA